MKLHMFVKEGWTEKSDEFLTERLLLRQQATSVKQGERLETLML